MLPAYVKPIRAVKGHNRAGKVFYNIYDCHDIKIAVLVRDKEFGLRFGRWDKDLKGLSLEDFLETIEKADKLSWEA